MVSPVVPSARGSPGIVARVLAVQRRHPRWGRRKLLAIRRRQEPAGERLADYAARNAIWCADFNGHVPVGDAAAILESAFRQRLHGFTLNHTANRWPAAPSSQRPP